MPRKEERRESGAKPERAGKVKTEVTTIDVIDLEIDETDRILQAKQEIKQEIKKEKADLYDKHRHKEKKAKTSKVKKEKKDDDGDRSRSRHKEKKQKDEKGKEKDKERRRRSRSGSRKRKASKSRSRSDSSGSSSSSSSSNGDPYMKFKPYTKVTLVNLVRKAELNGKTGQVVHPSCAVSPCPPGCLLVRLDTGREIAVRTPNLRALKSFHMTPQQSSVSQEERLQQVLSQIKMNVDCAISDSGGSRGGAIMVGDGACDIQGGIGHMV